MIPCPIVFQVTDSHVEDSQQNGDVILSTTEGVVILFVDIFAVMS